MTAPISNGPTTHGYTTMRDATYVGRRTALLLVQRCVHGCIACLFGATLCRAETVDTFADRSSSWGETGGTFAPAKCSILRHCGRAKVLLVSCVLAKE